MAKHKYIASHMGEYLAHDERSERIRAALKCIKSWQSAGGGNFFEAIAYRGQSGAITASIIAHKLRKPLILIRKEGDKGHSYYTFEGPITIKNYLIVDDFMSSGETFDAIVTKMEEHAPQAICKGMLEVTRAYERIDFLTNPEFRWEMKFSEKFSRGLEREKRWGKGTETEEDIHHLVARKQERAIREYKAVHAQEKMEKNWKDINGSMKDSFIKMTKTEPKYKVDHVTQEIQFDFGPERKLLPAPPGEQNKYQMFQCIPLMTNPVNPLKATTPLEMVDEIEIIRKPQLEPEDPASRLVVADSVLAELNASSNIRTSQELMTTFNALIRGK